MQFNLCEMQNKVLNLYNFTLILFFEGVKASLKMVIIINHETKKTTRNNGLIRKKRKRKMY